MALRTGKNADSDGFWYLIIAFGVLLFLPFLIVSFWSFSSLKRQYLTRPSVQRVMDIQRLLPFVLGAGGTMVLVALGVRLALVSWHDDSSLLGLLGGLVVAGAALFCGYLVARHLSVLYLGVLADSATGELYFPYDLQSYTIMDYLGFRFTHDFCNVDSIPLAQIERMTRGHRGKDLYLHGKFGSRGITMSSKQKRDECIAMVQSLSGKKGILAMEMEGY